MGVPIFVFSCFRGNRLPSLRLLAAVAGIVTALGATTPAVQDAKAPVPPAGQLPELTPGQYPLKINNDRDGALYVPRGYTPGVAAPLILYLHGAGGSGLGATGVFTMADEFGVIILAPDSREWTWDMLLGGFGPDVDFIREAFQFTFSRVAVDRSRMGVAGFSDGASYALSYGISSGDVFQSIMAFSPGVMTPIAAPGKPRIFISHGTSDRTMPIDITSRRFVPRLKKLGYDVTYREFDGRHTLPPPLLREAFEWFVK